MATRGPQAYIEDDPTHQSVRFGGRYVSLARLSEDLNIDHGYLSRIFSGVRMPSIPYLQRVATALRMSIPDFLECVADRKAQIREKLEKAS